MFKKIINPKEELKYRLNAVDTRYIINDRDRAIGFFAATQGVDVPMQISPRDTCFYVTEGTIRIGMDEKNFELKEGDMILIPKTSSFSINFINNSKAIFIRI